MLLALWTGTLNGAPIPPAPPSMLITDTTILQLPVDCVLLGQQYEAGDGNLPESALRSIFKE